MIFNLKITLSFSEEESIVNASEDRFSSNKLDEDFVAIPKEESEKQSGGNITHHQFSPYGITNFDYQ